MGDPYSDGWAFGAEHAAERAREVAAALGPWLPRPPRRVLDVGGADGAIAVALGGAACRVVCLDLDGTRLRVGLLEARRRGWSASYVVADAAVLPIADRSCDVVLLYGILELLPRPEALVAEASRVLAPGGVGYLVVPNPLSPITLLDDPHTHLPFTHLLPRRVAASYARLMRRNVKELGEHHALPTFGRLRRLFGTHGLRLHLVTNLGRVADPAVVISPAKRRLAHRIQRLGFMRFAGTRPGRALVGGYDRWVARSWAFVITRAS